MESRLFRDMAHCRRTLYTISYIRCCGRQKAIYCTLIAIYFVRILVYFRLIEQPVVSSIVKVSTFPIAPVTPLVRTILDKGHDPGGQAIIMSQPLLPCRKPKPHGQKQYLWFALNIHRTCTVNDLFKVSPSDKILSTIA